MEQVIEPTLATRLNDLRAQIKGSAYLPGDEGFAEGQAGWNLLVQHQPVVVIQAKDESDVQAAVRFANSQDLSIAVQATGHGQFKTCEGGLLLNISELTDVQIDPNTKSAKIGGGTRWAKVIEAAQPYNLMPVSGSSPGVGVVGYTIGGGYGIFSRQYGLGVDQVLSIRLVTPNGDIQDVTADTNPDLFWAILGGGGAFGVITQIEIQLHAQPTIFGGSVMFDASLTKDIYAAYLAYTKEAPEHVMSALTTITFPPVPFIPEFLHGRSMVIFSAAVLGDAENAEALLAPIRSQAGAEFDAFQPMTYADTWQIYNDPTDPLPATCRGTLLKDLEWSDLDRALEEFGNAAESPNLVFRIRHYGGAISRIEDDQTSIGAKRDAKYLMYFLGIPMGGSTIEAMHEQSDRVFTALKSQILTRGPLNWIGERNVAACDIQQHFTTEEYARQRDIKAGIDPENRFRFAGVGLD